MPAISLTSDARTLLESYPWPGNIRQLKNVAEQISVMEDIRSITAEMLRRYIPYNEGQYLPVTHPSLRAEGSDFGPDGHALLQMIMKLSREVDTLKSRLDEMSLPQHRIPSEAEYLPEDEYTVPLSEPAELVNESKSLSEMESRMIRDALIRHNGKRKETAEELGFSERTLYRKIKQLGLE